MGFLEPYTDDQLQKIYQEYGATVKTVDRDIRSLMEWMEKQPYLPNVKDEEFLRVYFIRHKTSLEKTKRALEMYYICKARLHDVFLRVDPTAAFFQKNSRIFARFLLPKVLPDLSRLFLSYQEPPEDQESLDDADTLLCYALTVSLTTMKMCGIHKSFTAIIDAKHITAARTAVLLSGFRKFILLNDTLSRVNKMYILNVSAMVEPLLFAARQISKKLFQERLIIWRKDEKDLAEVIPKECLPYEYGGTLGSRDELRELYLKEASSSAVIEWLEEEKKNVADLSKLPDDSKKIADMIGFGVEGSFRELNVE